MTQPRTEKVRRYAKAKVVLDPAKDGITHINVWSRGKTELGEFLSNFPYYPFKHPKYGWFDSMEGFWHWDSTGKQHDVFRKLVGLDAKNMAKQFTRVDNPNFHEEIKEAIEAKIEHYPLYKMKLIMNRLPLRHYFVFQGDKVVDQPQFMWQIQHITDLVNKWRSQ